MKSLITEDEKKLLLTVLERLSGKKKVQRCYGGQSVEKVIEKEVVKEPIIEYKYIDVKYQIGDVVYAFITSDYYQVSFHKLMIESIRKEKDGVRYCLCKENGGYSHMSGTRFVKEFQIGKTEEECRLNFITHCQNLKLN